MRRDIGRESYCVHCKKLDEFYPKRKLAAALYSETTVELSPSNLVKVFSFAESGKYQLLPESNRCPCKQTNDGMLINEKKKKTNCVQSKI